MHVLRTGSEELAPTAEVTVTVTRTDGTTVSKTTIIGFYERACCLGDFVYADGSYSDVYDSSKTLVGICFYINPDNPQLRLMLSVQRPGDFAWGISADATISLVDDPTYNVKDIVGLKNWTDAVNKTYEEICEQNTEPPVFKKFDSLSIYSHVGFTKADRTVGVIEAGDNVPYGQYETALIIEHRNKILRDSGINMPIPVKTSQERELTVLQKLMDAQDSTLRTYYYPAASVAYAYEPMVKSGEELHEKFKAHNWFLPSAGDCVRIAWYMDREGDSANGIFEKAINLGLITRMEYDSSNIYAGWQTSCEVSSTVSVRCARKIFANSYRTFGLKSTVNAVVPICKF